MIEIKTMEPRDEKRQVAFFTIDDQEFSCGNVPAVLTKTEDIQAYLDGRANEFTLILLKRQYPGSDHLRFQKNTMTEIQAMNEWISKGHKNKVITGYKDKEETKPVFAYEVIAKKPLTYKHPKSVGLKSLIEKATSLEQVKAVIQEML